MLISLWRRNPPSNATRNELADDSCEVQGSFILLLRRIGKKRDMDSYFELPTSDDGPEIAAAVIEVPQDGDALDILVLGDTPILPSCVYNARPIRSFVMLDQSVSDEKILVYATANPRAREIQSYMQVRPHILLEIEHFFSVYKDLEEKQTKVISWKDRFNAFEVIRSSHERFIHHIIAQ